MKGAVDRPYLETEGRTQWETMEEFEADLEEWRIRNYLVLLRRDTKTSRSYNLSNKFKPGNPHYIDEAKSRFAYKSWRCVHFGKEKSLKRDSVKRKVEGRPAMGCDFRIHAAYKPFFGKVCCSVKVHVGEDCLPNGHNHELSESRFLKYKQTRKLSEEQKRRQRVLMNLGTPAREALKELRRSTGVEYTLAAIYNFRRKERLRPQKETNELDLIKNSLLDYVQSFPGLRYEIVTASGTESGGEDKEGAHGVTGTESELHTLQAIHVLLPGGHTFSNEFGEVIYMDGASNANDDGLGVLLLSVEDGFGKYRIVQASFIASEDGASMIKSTLRFYRRHAGGSVPSTILVDKDCDTLAIREVLNDTEVLLCRWHVIEDLNQQIAAGFVGRETQRVAENLIYRMAYSKGEDDYAEKWELLKSLGGAEVRGERSDGSNGKFLEYFLTNCHFPDRRNLWVQYGRKSATTFSSDTKSRVEEVNKLLRTFKSGAPPLYLAVGDLLRMSSSGMRNFKDLTYEEGMLEPAFGDRNILFFQEFSTPPAFKIMKRELVFSQLYEVDSHGVRDAEFYRVVRRDNNLDGMDGFGMSEESSCTTVAHNTESQKVITEIIRMSKTPDGQREKELSDTHGGVGVVAYGGGKFPSVSHPLFRCSCTIHLNYGALPCRHIFTLALFLYQTTSIFQLIPKRWSRTEMVKVAVAIDQELAVEGQNRPRRNSFHDENGRLSDALRSANESEKEPLRTCRRLCNELAATVAFSTLETSAVIETMCVILALTDAAKRGGSPNIQDIQKAMSISDSVKLEDLIEGRIEMGRILAAWRRSMRRESDVVRDRSETGASPGHLPNEINRGGEVRSRNGDLGTEGYPSVGEIRMRRRRSALGDSEIEVDPEVLRITPNGRKRLRS